MPAPGEWRDDGAVDRARGLLGQRQQRVALVVEVRVERPVAGARQRDDVGDPSGGVAALGERLAGSTQEALARRSGLRFGPAAPQDP